MSTAVTEVDPTLDLHAGAPAAGGSLRGGELGGGVSRVGQAAARPLPLLLLHQAVAIVGAAAQIVITVSQWSQATNGMARAQTAVLSVLMSGLALAMLRWCAGVVLQLPLQYVGFG